MGAHKCQECEREITDDIVTAKDMIALNKKFLDRHTTLFFCAECFAEYLEIEVNDLPELVERCKAQGCALF
jgi:DNA-directed RNA polymerase subunit RPC12/RpoP